MQTERQQMKNIADELDCLKSIFSSIANELGSCATGIDIQYPASKIMGLSQRCGRASSTAHQLFNNQSKWPNG